MSLRQLKIVIIYIALIMASNYTMADILTCPESIQTSQSLVKKISRWQSFIDDWNHVYSFNRITFYSGHPKMHASLAPDNEQTRNNKLTWTFGKDKVWLACGYSNTDIKLIRELPNSINTCTATYDSSFSKVTEIKCD